MHDRKMIGIIACPNIDKDNDQVISLVDYYRTLIINKGFIPLIIPPMANIDYEKDQEQLSLMEKNMYLKLLNMCDGLIIPGGKHIYNYIFYVVSEALKKDIPILGTCMGMQAIAIVASNYKQIITANNSSINHARKGEKYVHKIRIEPNTKLYDIIGKEEIEVNSCHNYHIKQLDDYVVSSYAPDGIVESIELPDKKFVIGVQWHPERMYEYDSYQDKLLTAFFEECYEQEKISL